MNIEIANRLVKLRKLKGYSQEELANKLGISRQAVSKWERAEASPDTDNLICLAKLYNVSLDELLQSDQSIEEIVESQIDGEKDSGDNTTTFADKNGSNDASNSSGTDNKEDAANKYKGYDRVHIGSTGIHVKDDEDEVHIGLTGISVQSKDGTDVHIGNPPIFDFDNIQSSKRKKATVMMLYGALPTIALIIYFLLSLLLDNRWWQVGYTFIIFAVAIPSIFSAVFAKRFNRVNITLFVLSIYLFIGQYMRAFLVSDDGWMYYWPLLLIIPIWYIVFGYIDRHVITRHVRKKKQDKNIVDAVDIKESESGEKEF